MKTKGLAIAFLFLYGSQCVVSQQHKALSNDTLNSSAISEKKVEMHEIEVKGRLKDANIKAGSTGIDVDVKELKLLPKFAGESDPYKALQYMGGVSLAGEASSGLYVRGGNNDQNLILLNGTLIQNPTHVFGMFSVFNSDIIDQMRFIKSGIPAEYGGRLSSVVDINTNNSIPEKISVDGSVGMISSRISTHIPLNSKFSFYTSLRDSYVSSIVLPLLTLFGLDKKLTQNQYDFWDANAGFTFIITPRTKITGHIYKGEDKINIGFIKKLDINGNSTFWGNLATGVQLNHIFNENWSMNHQLNYSVFDLQSSFQWFNSTQIIQSQFKTMNYKADFFHIVRNHQFKFGTEVSYNSANPNHVKADSILPVEVGNHSNQLYSAQITGYLRDEWTWKSWQFNIGLRANLYAHLGPYTDYKTDGNVNFSSNSIVKTFPLNIEPRLFSRYLINSESSVKIAATRHFQYLNQIPVVSLGIPVDLQIPASLNIMPQASWHFSAGYFRNFNHDNWESSVEIYYKTLENQLEFKNGIETSFTNQIIENNLMVGKGWTYGGEWKLRKSVGKFTGWISYNIAWSYRQFDQINNGISFLAYNDRRHDLSVIGMYDLNHRWNFSAVFVYATGNRMNLPVSWYIIADKAVFEYGKYNAFVMPAYSRLDISANYKLKPWHDIKSELNFSVYNIYNRANPFQLYFTTNSPDAQKFDFKLKMSYLLPIIPSVSWTFHF